MRFRSFEEGSCRRAVYGKGTEREKKRTRLRGESYPKRAKLLTHGQKIVKMNCM